MPKRIIVGCDGTWKNSDKGFDRTSFFSWKNDIRTQLPSNVTRLCRAISPRADDGTPQIVLYQPGLGSEDNIYSYFVGGFLAEGISENIREVIGFLSKNYEDGDEIFLIGFSRGAFTARSIMGFTDAVGLLTRDGMVDFYQIFQDWEHQSDSSYQQMPAQNWPGKRPSFKANPAAYVQELRKRGMSRKEPVPIKCCAVWDTVGSLGIPTDALWGKAQEYAFINTEIATNVEYAFQALALDEKRAAFSPTIWESPKAGSKTRLKKLKQCWMPGVHSSVGGTYADTNTSDVSLAWMSAQLQPFLKLDKEYILQQQKENIKWYKSSDPTAKKEPETPRPWGFGKIWPSGSWYLSEKTRTPGTYNGTNEKGYEDPNHRLQNTAEFIHPSVKLRWGAPNRGVGDKGDYIPDALSKNNLWGYYTPNQEFSHGKAPWPAQHDGLAKWATPNAAGNKGPVYILEDTLEPLEIELVRDSPDFQTLAGLQALAKV